MTDSPNTDSQQPDSQQPDADADFLEQSIQLAVDSVDAGGGPFGAVVVRSGQVVATGQNRVTRDDDPTAHAEIVAIRAACSQLGTFSLEGCVLYTSCEPCPMCLAASMWSRLETVVYAADRHDAARGGFDDTAFYELFAQDRHLWDQPVISELRLSRSEAPFHAWRDHSRRIDY